jgi:membrane protein implicated in regulation of membrane protease activity
MSELPHEFFWFTAAIALTLVDRVLGTGYILTAIGVACLGGVMAAVFSDLGLAFESAVTIWIAGPLIYIAALRYSLRKARRENGKSERNVKAMAGVLGRFATKLDSVVIIIASIVLILCTGVAVAADAKPAN